MNIKLLTIIIVLFTSTLHAQEVKWLSFDDASVEMQQKPKKIIIDVYTDWCSWCKKMDQTTFADPVIAAYMDKFYYSVKFNAESDDSLVFKGRTFKNPNPTDARSVHQFAKAVLQGKLSYPSYVLMDENFNIVQVIVGYKSPEQLEPVLHYFQTESYKTTKWPDYEASFKGSFK